MPARFVKEVPPTGVGRYQRKPHERHVKIHKRLHAKPGEWLKITDCTSVSAAARLAHGIRSSKFIAFQDAKYDAHIRGTDVYAKLVVE